MALKTKELPGISLLRDYFDVDFNAGVLRWRDRGEKYFSCGRAHKQFVNRFVGKVAGNLLNTGYWSVRINGKCFQVHRIIWYLYNDVQPGLSMDIDHVDGNKLNNSITNLRLVERTVNTHNQVLRVNNNSGVTGVHLCDGGRGNLYYRAKWQNLDGSEDRKNFPIRKYGEEEAFRLACEYRAKMIEELNKQGAGYSERHGK
jgi:hypothetical protein